MMLVLNTIVQAVVRYDAFAELAPACAVTCSTLLEALRPHMEARLFCRVAERYVFTQARNLSLTGKDANGFVTNAAFVERLVVNELTDGFNVTRFPNLVKLVLLDDKDKSACKTVDLKSSASLRYLELDVRDYYVGISLPDTLETLVAWDALTLTCPTPTGNIDDALWDQTLPAGLKVFVATSGTYGQVAHQVSATWWQKLYASVAGQRTANLFFEYTFPDNVPYVIDLNPGPMLQYDSGHGIDTIALLSTDVNRENPRAAQVEGIEGMVATMAPEFIQHGLLRVAAVETCGCCTFASKMRIARQWLGELGYVY